LSPTVSITIPSISAAERSAERPARNCKSATPCWDSETDLDWAGIRGSANIDPTTFGLPAPCVINPSTSLNWDLTARARVGYANDNWLF
jgi:outer membrane immunogenic protein